MRTSTAQPVVGFIELGVPSDRIETVVQIARALKLGARIDGSVNASTLEILAELADLDASGTVEVSITATYPLNRVTDAYAELERRHARGKILLVP